MVMLALSSQWIPAFAGMTDRAFLSRNRQFPMAYIFKSIC